MMKVAFFSNQFASAEGHGIRRYSLDLVSALKEIGSAEIVPVAGWTDRSDFENYSRESGLQLTGLGRHGTKLAWTFLDWPSLESCVPIDIEIVHAASLGYPISTRKPFIVTIHDLGPLTQPEYFRNTRPWVMKKALRQAERQADQIICVSKSTADEVCNYLGSSIEARISIVHEAADTLFEPPATPEDSPVSKANSKGRPFILMAGKISPRKNVQGVLSALVMIGSKIPHEIVLVGGDGWETKTVLGALNDPGLSQRVRLCGFVSDAELAALYQRAALYIHPSLYEGFGLTILEAMSCGTPVITSNRASLPEIAGDGALLVDPTNIDEMVDAIMKVCLDKEFARQLGERGKRRALNFSWQRAANETLAVYRKALKVRR